VDKFDVGKGTMIDLAKLSDAAAAARAPGETSEKLLNIFVTEGFIAPCWQYFPSLRVAVTADGDIDADGAFRAYHQDSGKGLDALANAGHSGNWFGIVTDRNGVPFIQGEDDPAPGYYISSTSYQWDRFPRNNPRRYLDSATVPFIVVENFIRNRAKGVVLGCQARVTNLRNRRSIDCVVGDMGPLVKIGELSIAAAAGVGLNGNPRTGGVDDPTLLYEIWPDIPAVVNGVTYNLIRSTPQA
jgi:hypothetical protein